MPKRSRRFVSGVRRRFKKRRIGGRFRSRKANVRPKSMVRSGVGFPKKMLMTHKYREVVNITSSAGVIQKYQFSCNGLFDPNITGSGQQPYYFDQLTALYDHYCVIGSKAKFTIATPGNTAPYGVCVYIDDDTTTSNVNDIVIAGENTSGKRIKMAAVPQTRPMIENIKWSAKKYFGKGVLANDELQGTSSANPTEQSFYTVAVQGFVGSGVTAPDVKAVILAEIEYIVVWKELKEVAGS